MSWWSYAGQSYDGILWREDTEPILLGCWYRICGDRFPILDWFIQFVLCFLFLSLLSLPCHSSLGLPLTHPCPHLSSFPFPLILQHSRSHIFPSPPTLLNTEHPRSMDLPWNSPRTPLLPMDTHLQVFPCFPSPISLSSLHPCFLVIMCSLLLLLSYL